MAAPQRTAARAVRLLGWMVAAALLFYEGFALVERVQESKIVATLVAVVWGVGSVALLFYVLNLIAEILPERARRRVLPVTFAGPALALLIWFLVLPTARTIWLSLYDDTGMTFVGLDNYVFAFTDSIMLESFLNNLLWMVLGTGLCVGLGLLIAILADRSRAEPVWKALIFMPMAISFVGAGVIWKFIYAYQGEGAAVEQIGLMNAVVVALGWKAQAWLQVPAWNNLFLIVIMAWLQTGYAMVIISAAIKAVPGEIVEAARVDGAAERAIYFKIVIPLIRGSLITVATTIVIFSLKLFDIVRVMTGGNYGTNVIANVFYEKQFTSQETGRASAVAIVLLIAVVPILIYNLRQFADRKAFR